MKYCSISLKTTPFPAIILCIISGQGWDQHWPLRAHTISYWSCVVQKVVFKLWSLLSEEITHLARNLSSLLTPFPIGRKIFVSLEIGFFPFPFEYTHKTQRIQNLIAAGKQLYPLLWLQGLTSFTLKEEALTSSCNSLVIVSIWEIKKRFCSSLSYPFH